MSTGSTVAAIVAIVAMVATQGASASASPPTAGERHEQANVVRELRASLADAHGTLDGRPTTGLVQNGWCRGTVATSAGGTAFEWRDLGAFAPRLSGGRTWFAIAARGARHVIAYDAGMPGVRVDAGFGMLDEECHGYGQDAAARAARRP